MDEKKIKEIVTEVFHKARANSISHTKSALSNAIAEDISEAHGYIHARTLERAYDRYINGKTKYGKPQTESVALLCNYLGYQNYADYIKNKYGKAPQSTLKKVKWGALGVMFGIGCFIALIGYEPDFLNGKTGEEQRERCMTWADSVYVEVSCNTAPYSDFGTKTIPLDRVKLESLKKVSVTQAYPFFSEDGRPLVWYLKNKEGEIDYFTAPGLHPISGETLRKITPHIIQKYVPLHRNNKDSFVR